LRHLDWRFLLPAPAGGEFDHLLLLGGPQDLADRVVESGVARRVSRNLDTMPRAGTVDALILLHDARTPLGEAVSALRPQGALYYEADRRISDLVSFSPAAMRHKLQQCGLAMTGIYWIRPDFAQPQIYLPLDRPQVLRWYTRSLFVATTPARRLFEQIAGMISWLQAYSPLSLVRSYAVTAVMGAAPTSAPSMLGDPRFPDELRQPDIRPMLLTAGHDDWNRVIVLPFSSRSTRPIHVLKFSRLAARNALTENEHRVLGCIQSCLDERMARTVPKALGLIHWKSLAVSIESCVPGRLFSAITGRWGLPLSQKIDHLYLAANWLTEFHRQTQLERLVWNQETHAHWIEEALTAYAAIFDLTAEEERLFAAVRRRSQDLQDASLPLVWEHYGFDDQNLYRQGDEVYVIDWEGSSAGLPLFDLLYFIVRWNDRLHAWNGEASLRGFCALFCVRDADDPVRVAVDESIAVYLRGLGIDARFFPLLLVLMWVRRALSRTERQRKLGRRGVGLRSDNIYVEYVARLADSTGLLFDERGGEL
jgi:hypothetical protein